MKVTWRTEWPLWVVLAAMVVLTALVWQQAPDRIPTHWDSHGNATDYGSKWMGLGMAPALALCTYLLFLLLPRWDPLHANYESFRGAYTTLRYAMVLFFAAVHGLILLWVGGHPVPMDEFMPLAVGALFIVMGVVLGKLQPNWFLGIRTPWTLSSRRSWTRTHRAARWLFIAAGVGFAAGGLLQSEPVFIASVIVTVAGALGTVVYSYFVWRDDPERIPPAGSLHAK